MCMVYLGEDSQKNIFKYKLFLISVILLAIFSPAASAAELTVGSSGYDYTGIQDAINAAAPDDTILVHSGTYNETLSLDKRVTLCGDDTGEMPLVNKPLTEGIIKVTADGAVIKNLAVAGSGKDSGETGISVEASNVEIRNCHLYNNHDVGITLGIYSDPAVDCIIEGCTLDGNSTYDYCKGIILENADNCHIFSNELSNHGYSAILVTSDSSDNLISGNTLTDNNMGISMGSLTASDTGNVVSGNTCISCRSGFSAYDCRGAGIVIRDETALGGSYGFSAEMSEGITIENITASECGIEGVSLISVSDISLTNSTLESTSTDCAVHGLFMKDVSDSLIYNNIFNCRRGLAPYRVPIYVSLNISKTAGTNIRGGSFLAGNLWLSPDGDGFSQTHADYDLDGICDSGYDINDAWGKPACTDFLPIQNGGPSAAFTAPSSVMVGVPAVFNDTSVCLNNIDSWSWDFGDGTSATQQNASHTYETEGTYQVSLTASNGFGTNTITQDITVGPFTIQGAINAASPGDTIIVPAGTYAENVVLNKSVRLCGDESGEMPLVEKPGTSIIISVTADGAVIENLAVAGSGDGYYDAGIHVEAGNVEIRNCHLYDNTHVGILLGGSDGVVEGCTLECNSASDSSSGIRLINADNCHIFSNELRDFGYAAILVNGGSSDNLISGNTLTDNNKGISLEYLGSGDAGNTLVGNTCLSSKYGVYISDCDDAGIVIRDGTILKSDSGVYINDSDVVVIDNMTIMESGENGVELGGLSSDVTLTNSTIESTSTAFGVSVIASSDSHIFNNIFNCTRNVIIHGSNPNILWNTDKREGPNVMGGPTIGGNLWLTPLGTGFSETHADTNSDGICDEEYEIDGANIDHFPLHTCIPTANFTYDPAGGSTPLDVQFTDASYGVGNLGRLWNFGSGTSADLNPVHTFADNGTYEVSLTVTSAFGSNTKTAEVTALAPPQAVIDLDQMEGNSPLTVQFTDESTGCIFTRTWDFDDGTTSGDADVSHIFDTGTYNVTLNVSNTWDSDELSLMITVHEAPEANFTPSPAGGNCPLEVVFNETSAGDVTSWTWDFGDGASATGQNVTHEFLKAGTFTVNLTAGNAWGSDTHTESVTVLSPAVADFTQSADEGNSPLTVGFTDSSDGNVTSWAWEFGDGNVSSERSPSHEYTTPGTYRVILNASNAYGFSLSESYVHILPPPVAEFSFLPAEGNCPMSVDFTDASTGNVTSWFWDFGDGNVSADQSPSHEYVTPGTYAVVLNASNAYGFNSLESELRVLPPPVANFTLSADEGNAPLSVDFTDVSAGNVTSWAWKFGDGGISADQNPSHEYSSPGTYTVVLNVSNSYGYSLSESSVSVLSPPVSGFMLSTYEGNAPLSVDFYRACSGNVTSIEWDLGDGNSSPFSSLRHEYTTPDAGC